MVADYQKCGAHDGGDESPCPSYPEQSDHKRIKDDADDGGERNIPRQEQKDEESTPYYQRDAPVNKENDDAHGHDAFSATELVVDGERIAKNHA